MTSRSPLKLGTRGSDLARTQSTTVAEALRAAGHDVELTIIKTAGDRDQTSQFGSIGALDGVTVIRLDPQRFVPAPAQGALAVQCRRDDARVLAALAALDHPASHAAVDSERDALRRAEGGCDVAFGAFFVHAHGDAGRRPGAQHELLGMYERSGSVRVALGVDGRVARRVIERCERREHAGVVAAALDRERALRGRRHEALRVQANGGHAVQRAVERLALAESFDTGGREQYRVEVAFA